MSEELSAQRYRLTRGERIVVAVLLALIALASLGLIGAVVTATMPSSGPSTIDIFAGGAVFIVACLAGLCLTALRIWWVRQPNRHLWRTRRAAGVLLCLLGFLLGVGAAIAIIRLQFLYTLWAAAAVSAWLGAGFIYSDARRHPPGLTLGVQRASYVVTAAGALSLLYTGGCVVGTLSLASVVAPPQGTPFAAIIFGLPMVAAAGIIAGFLLYAGSLLRR